MFHFALYLLFFYALNVLYWLDSFILSRLCFVCFHFLFHFFVGLFLFYHLCYIYFIHGLYSMLESSFLLLRHVFLFPPYTLYSFFSSLVHMFNLWWCSTSIFYFSHVLVWFVYFLYLISFFIFVGYLTIMFFTFDFL